MAMENSDWFRFVSDPPLAPNAAQCIPSNPSDAEKPVAEKVEVAPPPPQTQVPTPPTSSHGSPTEEEAPDAPTIVSVSTTFYPGAALSPLPPDLVFLTSDTVFFYVHSAQLLSVSSNRWNDLIPASLATGTYVDNAKGKQKDKVTDIAPIARLPELSGAINVVLHTVYGMSCAQFSPTAPMVLAATEALAKYGVSLAKHAAAGTPLYDTILSLSPIAPIELYTLAARNGLETLAIQVSSHLLSCHIADLTDEAVEKMGAVYFKRMVFLHLGRVEALKRMLLPPPQEHAATPECDYIEQKKLTRAWALASAYIAWDARPDLSPVAIESTLFSLNDHLSCELCKQSLRERIKQLIVQWALVKRTI